MCIHKVIKAFGGTGGNFYANKKVMKYILSFSEVVQDKPVNVVANLLDRIAKTTGFDVNKCGPMRSEGEGVFRIGHQLKRIIGFNATIAHRLDFVALDCDNKSGQRRSRDLSKKYRKVAKIKRNVKWVVVEREDDL